MKKYTFIVTCMLMSLTLAAQSGQLSGAPANVEAVDLGLPSGTRWASCNVGASSPEEYGGYYSWGETEEKDDYSWNNYNYLETYEKNDGYTRIVCKDIGDHISGTQYDVAHVKWGGNWRMPTKEEMEELLEHCTAEQTVLNNVEVMKLTGPNGNSIFFPFPGAYFNDNGEFTNEGYCTMCWSGDLDSNSTPWALAIYNSDNYNWVGRYSSNTGFSVRPVIKIVPSAPRSFIDLGLPSGTRWANMNVGASSPEEYGTYFAWGETLGKNSYSWDNYMCPELTCGKSGDPVFDLVGDKADIAGTKFDAATINWGASWNMPTAKQVEELASNCYSSLVTINGVQCRKLKSRINGNEIIFPLAGARWFEDFAYEGSLGYYWSSTLKPGGYVSPCRLIVRDDAHGWGWSMGGENDRFCAFPIRPVFVENSSTEDTITYHKFSVAFNDNSLPEKFGSGVSFQRNGESDSYSLSIDGQQSNESTFDISRISYINRKSMGQFSLPKASGLNINDITITVDGDTISTDGNGNYDAAGSILMATNTEGEIVYMNIASVEDGTDAVGADLNAKESALTLMLPLVPNIFVSFDDEYLPKLKEMIWDVEEVKQLAAAIDRSVVKYGYTDFGEINKEAIAARNKISQLLHLDKWMERQSESVSLARRTMLMASGSKGSPYIVNPYDYAGLQVEITDSEKKQFYHPYTISGYNCEVTAYNSNRFAYSSMVKGKYDAETNTYYIPDLGNDYDYYKNILKPQKVSTFMNTFTSFKYEDLERLGEFIEESVDLVQGDIGFGELHWDDMKKSAYFDISEQDDAIVLLFPRGNDYMLGYNVLMSIVKPIVKSISKKAGKMFDSDVFVPFICGQMMGDPNYALELSGVLNNPDLSASERIEKITSVSWNKFFKEINNLAWDKLDEGIKDALTDLIDVSVLKAGSIQAASDWVSFKAAFKMLNWIKKYGDILTGVLGTLFEDNAVYQIHWEANGQFVLAQDEVTVGEGETVNVRILVGNNSYHAESSDEKIATVTGAYNKVKIHGVDAGDAVITVKDYNAQKTAKISVHVTGIQTFVMAESVVSVPMYKDCSVTIERGDGPFHIFGGNEKIAVAKFIPKFFPGEKNKVVISGVSEGSTIFYVYNEATDQTLPLSVKVTAEKVVITDERIVDLGLSVNWANCNVGASEPQEYGDYFAWGEVESKDIFSPNNYKYYSNGKFANIGNDISGTKYDVATHVMGKDWRMPTKAEFEELINKCEWKFMTYRKVTGWKVTGPNGNSIFMPATGYVLNDWNENVSINGFYWSSNITDNLREVYTLYTSMHNYKMYYSHMNRFEGRTVRAVTESKGVENVPVQTEIITVNGVSFKMVAVEGGTFQMGSPDDDPDAGGIYSDEKPQHKVELSNFAIGETEVTQALWKAVMGDNPSSYIGYKKPVEQVSWDMCQTFISKLNALTGRSFRLPTEAEWEYAARGGKNSKGYKFSGSNDVDAVAWNINNSSGTTHVVGTKDPNELGLYDMSGNVWEWCQDWYDGKYYSKSPVLNPCNTTEPTTNDPRAHQHIHRGGSISYIIKDLRNAMRGDYVNDPSLSLKGLRLVISDGKTGYKKTTAVDEAYAVYDNGTLSFYCDGNRFSKNGETFDMPEVEVDNHGYLTVHAPAWNHNSNYYEQIKQVVFDSSFAKARPTNTWKWFGNMDKVINIEGLQHLNTSEVLVMEEMFSNCTSLRSLDVSHFDTSNTILIDGMFEGCSSLTNLDVSHFNTSNVANMTRMFSGCSSLTNLDVSHFDTSKTGSMGSMFRRCSGLLSIDVSHFNTTNVEFMTWMFEGCSSLTNIDISKFDTSSLYYDDGESPVQGMFNGCEKLNTIYCGDKWKLQNTDYSSEMFVNCTSLVGGRGTKYDSNHTDAEYARIDGGSGKPGYFTDVNGSQPNVPVPAEAVDLGLPSGTLWASCNVGATKPEEECQEVIVNCTNQVVTLNDVKGLRLTSRKNGKSIFLPFTGCRWDSGTYYPDNIYCWLSNISSKGHDFANYLQFREGKGIGSGHDFERFIGLPVRPVFASSK